MVEKKCENCGAAFFVKPYREDSARFCSSSCWTTSIESKNIVSKTMVNRHKNHPVIGEENPNWRGGITPKQKARLMKASWRKLRKIILEKNNNSCQYCGSSDKLHVHHILPYRYGGYDEEQNLTVICSSCHPYIEKATEYQIAIDLKCMSCEDTCTPRCTLYPFKPNTNINQNQFICRSRPQERATSKKTTLKGKKTR